MLTINQERLIRFFNDHPNVFTDDIELYFELGKLCARLREGHKKPNSHAAVEERTAIHKRMDSILLLLGLQKLSDDDE